ncbi:MAG: fibronectin type III domain-containing protein [Chthoniobacterales bacterium]
MGGEYGSSITFASSRAVQFDGLVSGTRYTFQLRAIGGSTGRSDWSDERTHMAL